MKKYLAFVTIIAMLFSLASCTVIKVRNNSASQTESQSILFAESQIEISEVTSPFIPMLSTEAVESTVTEMQTTVCSSKNISDEKDVSEYKTEAETSAVSTTVVEKTYKKAPDYIPEKEIFELIAAVNAYRLISGSSALEIDYELCKLAYIRAQEQEHSEGHIRPDGSPFYTIKEEYGYTNARLGENIAIATGFNAEVILNGWKNSEGHNENMLEEKWTRTGMALYVTSSGNYCFVQLFAY